jgi:hypothetical protein
VIFHSCEMAGEGFALRLPVKRVRDETVRQPLARGLLIAGLTNASYCRNSSAPTSAKPSMAATAALKVRFIPEIRRAKRHV